MGSERYPYHAELDSDDEGFFEYDWDDDSQLDDDDLTYAMDRLQLGRAGAGIPRPPSGYVAVPACVVCKLKPQYNQNGKSYPTCGLTCASKLQASGVPSSPIGPSGHRFPRDGMHRLSKRAMGQYPATSSRSRSHRKPKPLCVVCKKQAVYKDHLTCGLTCLEKLCKDGPSDTTLCTYCHKQPKFGGKDQCGQTCADKAKVACLLCKVRPKLGRYQLCGSTCKRISTKSTPLILEIPKEHETYEMVENKFKTSWSAGASNPLPTISKIFKIIENEDFLKPYDQYRRRVGPGESYRYHGTGRQCQLGTSTTTLCTSSTCPVCNILKTSFNVGIAKASGAFGAGVYSSSASNKAYSYCGPTGAMLLTKVVLGKIRTVNGWNEVMSCPAGFDSVVYDRKVGNVSLNETIIYTNDAIRPVFLITF